jgi:hypothetical protein
MDLNKMKQKAQTLVGHLSADAEGDFDKAIDGAANVAKDKVGHDHEVDEAASKVKGFLPKK